MRHTKGTLIINPTALVVGNTVVVPDLMPGDDTASLDSAVAAPADAVTIALDSALSMCAEVAHRGLRHLPPDFARRAEAVAIHLTEVGLPKAGAALSRFVSGLTPQAWVDAQIRLTTTADAR